MEVDAWPRVFEDDDEIFIGMAEASNFFQFPAIVRSVTPVTGGSEVVVDVFNTLEFENLVWDDLRGIAAAGTPIMASLTPGTRLSILGVFSINLRRAMDLSAGASSKATAADASDAIEFFIDGKPRKRAIVDCE
jgi:hypothetical protein